MVTRAADDVGLDPIIDDELFVKVARGTVPRAVESHVDVLLSRHGVFEVRGNQTEPRVDVARTPGSGGRLIRSA